MNVLLCVEDHFVRVGDQVYCRLSPPAVFQRYRAVWDEVVVLGRSAHADQPPGGAAPLDVSGVRLVGLPDYRGPSEYWKHRRQIREIARRTLGHADSIVLRSPGTTSNVVWSLLRGSGRPFGVEVVGDPRDALASGSYRHPLRPWFRWFYSSTLRRQCREACATAYVT